jgi:hypothetical protein
MSQPESSVCGFPLPQRPVVVASSACDFLRVLSGYSGNDRPLFVLGHVDHRPKADCRAGMAGRPNMFSHQNPNMANVNVGRAPSHRDRMLEERRLQRKVQPTVLQANTYEGRRAQEEQYKQQVEEERKKLAFQRQQQDEMKRQSRQQPPPMDFAAKAATNARVDDASVKKSGVLIWRDGAVVVVVAAVVWGSLCPFRSETRVPARRAHRCFGPRLIVTWSRINPCNKGCKCSRDRCPCRKTSTMPAWHQIKQRHVKSYKGNRNDRPPCNRGRTLRIP